MRLAWLAAHRSAPRTTVTAKSPRAPSKSPLKRIWIGCAVSWASPSTRAATDQSKFGSLVLTTPWVVSHGVV